MLEIDIKQIWKRPLSLLEHCSDIMEDVECPVSLVSDHIPVGKIIKLVAEFHVLDLLVLILIKIVKDSFKLFI
jgi:hypothetical protein